MRPRVLAALSLLASLAGAGCGPKTPRARASAALCSTARPVTKTNRVRPLRPADWFNLLVDRALDGSTADCTGANLSWPEPEGCVDVPEAGTPSPPRPFQEDDVVVQRVDEEEKLVWVVTAHFSNGDGMGPVALVSEGDRTVEVNVLGTLRAKARHARLKLLELGKTELLSAEGEACEREDDPATCRRSMVLLQKQGDHFVPLRIHARNGMCLGPAVVHLARQRQMPLQSGWMRRLELNSTVQAQPGQARLVVTEQVVVSDFDPSRPGVPPRPVRRADAEILLWPAKGGRLVASDSSLWTRILEQIGHEPGKEPSKP